MIRLELHHDPLQAGRTVQVSDKDRREADAYLPIERLLRDAAGEFLTGKPDDAIGHLNAALEWLEGVFR